MNHIQPGVPWCFCNPFLFSISAPKALAPARVGEISTRGGDDLHATRRPCFTMLHWLVHHGSLVGNAGWDSPPKNIRKNTNGYVKCLFWWFIPNAEIELFQGSIFHVWCLNPNFVMLRPFWSPLFSWLNPTFELGTQLDVQPEGRGERDLGQSRWSGAVGEVTMEELRRPQAGALVDEFPLFLGGLLLDKVNHITMIYHDTTMI